MNASKASAACTQKHYRHSFATLLGLMTQGHDRQLDLRRAAGQGRSHDLQLEAETTPQNTATAGITQINNMILQHVIAIDVAPASPVAPNPVITKAHNAGIIDYRRGIRLGSHRAV
jgi:hypothetical protein